MGRWSWSPLNATLGNSSMIYWVADDHTTFSGVSRVGTFMITRSDALRRYLSASESLV
jgi:hypothetical protein